MTSSENPATVVCIANEGNEVSLQLWKIYQTLPDPDARAEGMLRVIDEEGEDYLYPEENFAAIQLPAEMRASFERSVKRQRKITTGSSAGPHKVIRGRAVERTRKRARGA